MAVVLERGLEDQNYSVTLAKDGVQGFDLAKKDGFAAIILDVKLPLLDGYSVASLLRARGVALGVGVDGLADEMLAQIALSEQGGALAVYEAALDARSEDTPDAKAEPLAGIAN